MVAELGLLWNRPGTLSRADDVLQAQPARRTVQVHGTVPGVAEPYVWAQGPYLALPADQPMGFSTGRARTLIEIQTVTAQGKAARKGEDAAFGEQAEVRNAMQTCLAWDTIYDPLFDRVISPVSRIWNTNWGCYVMFGWDSYFAAAMVAVDNRDLAYTNAI